MDRHQYVVLFNIVFLLFCATIGQTEIKKKKNSSKLRLASRKLDENVTIAPNPEYMQGRNKERKILDKYRVIPAALTIMIFVVGSLSIFFIEIKRERKKIRLKSDDIDEDEDSELNAAWLSTLAKKSKRKGNVLERVRKMSLSIKGVQDEVDLEKQRKYKIYDEMLEKYRETLRVLRKGTKTQISNDGKPTVHLKKLAELHKQRTSDTLKSDEASESEVLEEPSPTMDQYSLTLEMLKQEVDAVDKADETDEEINKHSDIAIDNEREFIAENGEQITRDENEEQEIDPVFLTKRRRSSRFRKQAVVDEDGSFDKPTMSKATALFQSYMASNEDVENAEPDKSAVASEDGSDEDLELIKVLEKSSEAEISALHRIQKRMRPKSFIETLASIHRETTSLMGTHAYSMTSLAKTGSRGSLSNIGRKEIVSSAKSVEKVLNPSEEPTASTSPVLRGKQRLRNRPKSLYETGVTRRKLSQARKPRARPASLYIQHRIQEAIPETQREVPIYTEPGMPSKDSRSSSRKYLDIGSLHDLPFSSMTADEEENAIAEIEKQLIAQVCDENDLSNDEIKALERLLDDVSTYSQNDSPDSTPKVEKQYSFTDSISMFEGMDPNELEEADESEEMVLKSLKDVSMPSSSKRVSYSAYDNV